MCVTIITYYQSDLLPSFIIDRFVAVKFSFCRMLKYGGRTGCISNLTMLPGSLVDLLDLQNWKKTTTTPQNLRSFIVFMVLWRLWHILSPQSRNASFIREKHQKFICDFRWKWINLMHEYDYDRSWLFKAWQTWQTSNPHPIVQSNII
jgi:hypothetical protein